MRLGFIGTGEITSSIVIGLSSSGATKHSICLSPRNATIASRLANQFDGISVALSNQEVLEHSETIVIAVRPSVTREVVTELRFRPDHTVISLVSGLSLHNLSQLVAPAVRIARAVPLPSSAIRLSPTAIFPPDPSASELFATVGTAIPIEREREFDAICAATATIASYFAFTDAIAAWLQCQGISASQAQDYVCQLFLGVASAAVEKPEDNFRSAATAHATPGGINEQFLKHMTERGLTSAVPEGLDVVLRRIRGT